ncbi:hypothetical protein B6D17_07645 [Gilliamella apis]|nr:hypothetical protein B6D17_07645 [Gilliamella apis]OTQ75122.1 hypothetical protein B6C90_07105 [Gilliamella apis]
MAMFIPFRNNIAILAKILTKFNFERFLAFLILFFIFYDSSNGDFTEFIKSVFDAFIIPHLMKKLNKNNK